MKNEKKIFPESQKKRFRQFNRKRKLEALFNIAVANDRLRQASNHSSAEPLKKKTKIGTRGDNSLIKKEISDMMEEEKIKKNGIAIPESRPKLSEEEFAEVKKALRERKKFLKGQPRFWLRESGKTASLELPPADRVPLLLGDIQQLVLFGLVGNHIFQDHNRWCHLDHHGKVSQVVVVILEGVGYGDLLQSPAKPKKKKGFGDVFPHGVELIGSDAYDRNIADDFSLVPLSSRSCRSIFLKYGSKEAELRSKMFRTAFPIGVTKTTVSVEVLVDKSEIQPKEIEAVVPIAPPAPLYPPSDKFSRLQLLLSPSQLLEERYPVPIGELATKYSHYVLSKEKYAEVTPFSPMFGLDCEMCFTTARVNELTRVSVVDENHELVYETLVQPHNRIVNYLTKYSGITRSMMNGVKTRLRDVQNDLRRILPPDAILVGQSLNCDLHALQLFHPYCMDSSVIFNIHGERKRKTKLKTLLDMFVGLKIQEGQDGHDSVEDAAAALKLIQFKLTKYPEFGDACLGFDLKKYEREKLGPEKAEEELKRIEKEETEAEEDAEEAAYKTVDVDVPQPEVLKIMEASSLFSIASKKKKVGVFTTADLANAYSKYLDYPSSKQLEVVGKGSHGFTSDSTYKVVKNICQEVVKFDFALAHLKMDVSNEKGRVRAVNSCLKLASSAKDNALIVVIAGGRVTEAEKPEQRPGCFIGIKVQPYQQL